MVACHDAACATATLPGPADDSYVVPLLFSSTDTVGNRITRLDGSLQVAVGWFVGKDGDRYTVVARDSAGVELGSTEVTAEFPPATTSNGCPNYCASVTFGDQP